MLWGTLVDVDVNLTGMCSEDDNMNHLGFWSQQKYAVRVSQAAGTAWSAKSTRRGRSQRGRHLAVCPTGSVACGTT